MLILDPHVMFIVSAAIRLGRVVSRIRIIPVSLLTTTTTNTFILIILTMFNTGSDISAGASPIRASDCG
jgi:hypothetical protein